MRVVGRRVVFFVLGAWLFASALATRLQVPIWQSDLTLWRHAALVYPSSPAAWLNLSMSYFISHDDDQRERALWRAYESALTTRAVTERRRYEVLLLIDGNFVSMYRENGRTAQEQAWLRIADHHQQLLLTLR